MYRISGVVKSRVESDITAASVCVVLLLRVYWPGGMCIYVNTCESPLPPLSSEP